MDAGQGLASSHTIGGRGRGLLSAVRSATATATHQPSVGIGAGGHTRRVIDRHNHKRLSQAQAHTVTWARTRARPHHQSQSAISSP
eukprot:scaffold11865_cov103-Isochrysis_galbana.AAC.1